MNLAHPFLKPLWVGSLATTLLLGGCAAVSVVSQGEVVVEKRLVVQADRPWNQFASHMTHVPTWTHEGITVDELKFYVGIKDGQVLPAAPVKNTTPLTFKAKMSPQEVVALFQAMLTRDGSSFQLDKIEPTTFLQSPGFRFDYSLIRKTDDVQMKGSALGVIKDGELFVMHYAAPRLVFFPRYAPVFEKLASTATLRN
jgi:hypothetical protein